MKHWILRGTTAAAALMAANVAIADVTPEEIWQSWQDQQAAIGQPITADSVAREGDTLVAKGVKSASSSERVTSESLIPELRLKDQGDGTVEITTPGEVTFKSTTAAVEDMPAMTMDGTLNMPGAATIASGSADAIAYDFTIPEMGMLMNILQEGLAPGTVSMKLAGGKGNYVVSGPADAMAMDGSFSAASAALNVEMADPASTVKAVINAADLAASIKGTFVGLGMENASEAFAKGYAVDLKMSTGATSYDFDITGESGPGRIVGGSEGGKFDAALDKTRMMFAFGSKNDAVTISGMGIPFPEVKIAMAESGFNLTMPVGKSDAPTDFALLYKLVGLTLSDEIWGMMDPTGQLPHDPATLILDTKGTARLTTDIMDEAAMAALGDAPPGELNSLDINEIKLSVAGAELTGAGAFTFDNSDLVSFGGMPAPTGKLDAKLVGGNGLMDKLVAMGLLTEEDVMGARMMMMMFGQAVEGKDEVTSTVEAKDKHLYVNGQLIQ